jgi:hypothetical protein
MNRKIFSVIIFLTICLIFYVIINIVNPTLNIISNIPSNPLINSSPSSPLSPFINYKNKKYSYFIAKSRSDSDVELIPNFTEKKSAVSVNQESSCSALINGGFYDTKNKPLGYFRVIDKIIGQDVVNNLTNGYIWSFNNMFGIGNEIPPGPLSWIFQSGPMLVKNLTEINLSINNDNFARRSIAAVNTSENLIIMEIIFSDHINSGPLLSDVPEILMAINRKENLRIKHAINLDGGGASTFITETVNLMEIEPVGSFICIH